ncbi:MAG: SDR family oxidoreductase [Candidatus Methanomethylophilaceae archaeon]|nr:SDR family oxidoreductase [Candidatus Methanomethylophilaceae archaeon]
MNGTALITGASSGIGMCMARMLAEDGWNLIIVGRNVASMNGLRDEIVSKDGVDVRVIEKDLTQIGASEEIYQEVQSAGLQVDFLINCAGFGDFGKFIESDPKKQEGQILVNDLALTTMTRLFVPDMVARGSGRVLNVASIASFQPGPLMSVYYGTKAYVLNFTEAIAVELKGTGVKVSVVCPGPTDTPFLEIAGQTGQNMFKKSACVSPEKVARYGLKKAFKGKVVIVVGLSSKFLMFAERFLPRCLVRNVVHMIQRKPVSKKDR